MRSPSISIDRSWNLRVAFLVRRSSPYTWYMRRDTSDSKGRPGDGRADPPHSPRCGRLVYKLAQPVEEGVEGPGGQLGHRRSIDGVDEYKVYSQLVVGGQPGEHQDRLGAPVELSAGAVIAHGHIAQRRLDDAQQGGQIGDRDTTVRQLDPQRVAFRSLVVLTAHDRLRAGGGGPPRRAPAATVVTPSVGSVRSVMKPWPPISIPSRPPLCGLSAAGPGSRGVPGRTCGWRRTCPARRRR